MKPIIILAFANSQDAYLDSIKLEREGTSKALDDLNDRNAIGVRKIAHLSNEQLFYYLNRYRHQVRIFHYAGHANGSTLQLEAHGGEESAHAEGIAGLLGQSNSLDLVFLNGCATYGQVETLLDKGVKAVIATSVAINDNKAYKFSIKFYETLAAGETIGDAFEAAKSFLTQLGNAPEIQQRGLKLRRENKSETMPWGIYTKEGNEAVLDKKLPTEPFKYIVPEEDKATYEPNRNLSSIIFRAAMGHNKSFKTIVQTAKKNGNKLQLPDLQFALLNYFPASISTQLRELFSTKLQKRSRKHLQQLVNTYQSVLITTGNTLLAELWDAVKKHDLVLNDAQKATIAQYFNQNAFNYQSFDWLLLIDDSIAAFHKHFKLAPLEKNLIKDKPFYHIIFHHFPNGLRQSTSIETANQYLLDMFEELQKKSIDSEKIAIFCKKSEEHLTLVLKELSVLTHYKMAVIKEIQVNKFRHSPASYSHKVVALNSNLIEHSESDNQRVRALDNFTETCSVQLFQDSFSNGVNLFPFVIDKHSFKKAANSKTYFFAYREGNDRLVYRFLANWEELFAIPILTNEDILLDDEASIYKIIPQQFFEAETDLLGLKTPVSDNEGDDFDDLDDFMNVIDI